MVFRESQRRWRVTAPGTEIARRLRRLHHERGPIVRGCAVDRDVDWWSCCGLTLLPSLPRPTDTVHTMDTTVIAADGTYRADAYRSLVAKAADPGATGDDDGAYTVLAAYGAAPAAPTPLLAALLADVDAPEAAAVDAAAVAAAAAALSPVAAAAAAATPTAATPAGAAVTGGVAAVDDSSVLASPARGVVGVCVPPPPAVRDAAAAAAAAAARSAVWAATVADGLLWVVRGADLRSCSI